MNDDIKKWLLTGGGFAVVVTVLSFAGKYLMAQEAEKVVAPVRVEQQATSKMIADMQFEKRYDESHEMFMVCLEEYPREYCDKEDEWRWEVHYPYLDCIAGLEYAQRGDVCGPVPMFEPLEEVDP